MARRVNTKFLTILTVLVVGVLVTALLASKFMVRESPEKYVAAGTQYMNEKKYDEAAAAFGRAASLDQRNPALWVAYGDALNQLSPNEIEYMVRARRAWDQALAVDPNNKPALDRMMQFWSDVANLDSTRPEVFEGLGKTAAKLFEADPKNAAAEVAIQTSKIRPWLAGVERDEQEMLKVIAQLEKLIQKYPDNPDLPMFAAQAKLRLAERERQRERHADADKYAAEAMRIVDQSTKQTPSAAMLFSAAQVSQAYEAVLGATVTNDAKQKAEIEKKVAEVKKKKKELYARARQECKPDDPLYVYVHIAAARAAADLPEAEKILRELMAQRPDDQQVRLALAEQLATERGKQEEAIEILDRPFAPTGLIGPKAYLVRELQIRTLVTATNLRLNEFANADKDKREKLLPKIQDGLAKIEQKDGQSPRPLRLRGKLLRMQGETIAAIQTLEKARQIAEQQAGTNEIQGGDRIDRWEVIDLLARAYVETNQTGEAKRLLNDLVIRFPDYDPGRTLLAQLLVKEGNHDQARAHVKYLQDKKPNDPDVIKLSLQVMDPKSTVASGGAADKPADAQQQKQRIKETYSKLPEDTKPQILDKINAAMAVEQNEDAFRLLNKLQTVSPGDYEVARMGVRVYRAIGELDKAKEFVEVAFQANPQDERLRVLQKQVQDLTPEALMKIRIEEAEKSTDPFAKAMMLADAYRRLNRPEDSLKQLYAAQQVQPKNTDVTAMIFAHFLRQREFDKAEKLLEPLTTSNHDQAGGLLFRYQLAMARQDFPTALSYARGLVQRMGEFGQSWLAVAQAHQALGQTEEALNNYRRALEKQSDSPDALRGMVDCSYGLNRPADAKRYIQQARKAMPANAMFQELEIQHELNYGDPSKAIAPREELVRKSPDRAGNHMALGQAYMATARTYAAKGDKQKESAEMFAKALATFRTGMNKWPDEIAFYAYYAETCARSGNLADSEQVLKSLAGREAWKGKIEPQLLLAEYYGVARRPAEAEAVYHEVLKVQPNNTEVQVRLANLMLSQNKPDAALAALEANASDPKIARRRVEILMMTNKAEEADKAVTVALEKSPSNLELLHLAAGVNIGRSEFGVAEERLKRAMEIDARNPTTHGYMGLLRMNQPQPNLDEAIKYLTTGKDSPVIGTEARFALAECQKRKGSTDLAIRELEAALSAEPANRRFRIGLVDAYMQLSPPRLADAERTIRDAEAMPGARKDPELMQRFADILSAKGDARQAVDKIKEAVALDPNNGALVRTYLNMLLKVRKYVEVNQEVEKLAAAQKEKTPWWALQARAVAKRYLDRKDESIKDFEAALAAAGAARDDDATAEIVRTMGDVIGPDEVISRITARAEGPEGDRWKIMIARLQQMKGDNDAAVQTLEKVLVKDEQLLPADRENALRFGGTLYLVINKPEQATKCYEKLLAISPNDMTALNNMAVLLAEVVQPARPNDGLKYSQRAFDLMTRGGRRDPLVMDTHGWLLTLCGKLDEGIEVLRRANEIKSIPDAHYHLAEAYLRKEFAEPAQRELELAVALMKKYDEQKTPYDQTLKTKVEGAMARAGVMMRQKKSTAANAQ